MREYYVLHKTPEGAVKEQKVKARDHEDAIAQFAAKGCEVVKVSRVEDSDENSYERVGSSSDSAITAIVIALVLAAAAVAFLWWRR